MFAIVASRDAVPDSPFATALLSCLKEGEEGNELVGGVTATLTLCTTNEKAVKIGKIQHPGAKIKALEFFNAVQRHGGAKAVRILSLQFALMPSVPHAPVMDWTLLRALAAWRACGLILHELRCFCSLQTFVYMLDILQVSGRGSRDRTIALATELKLTVDDVTVLDFAGMDKVKLSSLLESDNAEHKRLAEQSKADLEQWFCDRLKAHALVCPRC